MSEKENIEESPKKKDETLTESTDDGQQTVNGQQSAANAYKRTSNNKFG